MSAMTFAEKIRAMMERSGLTYHQCCRRLGGAGGRTAARNKRQRRVEAARQERKGLR